jgi:hypothetical protein
MGVSSISLSISCGENGVDKNKSANDLSAKAIPLGIAKVHYIGSTTVRFILPFFEALHHACTTNGAKALHHYIEYCSCQGKLPCKEETKCHSWVYVSTCSNHEHIRRLLKLKIKQDVTAY